MKGDRNENARGINRFQPIKVWSPAYPCEDASLSKLAKNILFLDEYI